YNGLKLLGADGRVISAAAGQAVVAAWRAGQPAWVGDQQIGRVEPQE
ncbi:MAG: phosphoglucosamine mutase, partial [Planctomycetales bacterium]|nr:phosphoglucosamine mutase [Planctomycetales bacterium]